MKKVFIAVLAITLIISLSAPVMAQTANYCTDNTYTDETTCEANGGIWVDQDYLYRLDRIELTIDATKDTARFFDAIYQKCRTLQDVWNAEAFGTGNATEMTQADIDLSDDAGLPIARETAVVTQCFDFVTWYEGARKGEVDKLRNFMRDN